MRAEPLANDVSPWRQRLSEQLRSAVTRGVLWTTGGYGVGQALRLATNLVVTRLLNPEAFGLMAIVNSLLIGAEINSEIDFERLGFAERVGDKAVIIQNTPAIPTMAKEL